MACRCNIVAEDYRLSACVGFVKHFYAKYGDSGVTAKKNNASSKGPRRTSTTGSVPSVSPTHQSKKTTDGRDMMALTMSRNSTTSAIAAVTTPSDTAASPVLSRHSSPSSPRRTSVDSSGDRSAAPESNNAGDSATTSTGGDAAANGGSAGEEVKTSVPKKKRLSVKSLELAMARCEKYLTCCEHGDLDLPVEVCHLLGSLLCLFRFPFIFHWAFEANQP